MIQQWFIVRAVSVNGVDINEVRHSLLTLPGLGISSDEKIQVVEMPEADREHYDKLAILSDHLTEEIDKRVISADSS